MMMLMGLLLGILLTVTANRDNITDSRLEFSFDEILHDCRDSVLSL